MKNIPQEEIEVITQDENYKKFMMSCPEEFFERRDELELCPEGVIKLLAYRRFRANKKRFKTIFEKNNVSLENYPKISKYFFSDL